MMLPADVRKQLFFAFSPKRAIYNPITGFINTGMELEESVYLLTYKLLSVLPSIKDNVVTDISKEKGLELDKRFDYGNLKIS